MDTFRADDVAKELNGGPVELTLFELQVELEFPKPLQDLRHVVATFGQVPEVYQNVVNVDYHESMEELPELLVS